MWRLKYALAATAICVIGGCWVIYERLRWKRRRVVLYNLSEMDEEEQ